MATVAKQADRPVAPKSRGPKPRGLSALAAARYHEIRAACPGVPSKLIRKWSGYSPDSDGPSIDAQLAMSITRQREAAIRHAGYSISKGLKRLVDVMDDGDALHGDAIRAVHEANAMLPGYHAPERIEVQSKGVFVELSNLSQSDIQQLLSVLGEQTSVSVSNDK
jgi:hypothetical protein